jgi:cell wall assembly regulator SMI1
MTAIELDPGDAAELAEMLTFIRDWLTGPDSPRLAESFQAFIGVDAYDLADLRTDLARFTFLLGHDDGEQLFGSDRP